jgi:hypothetical protein
MVFATQPRVSLLVFLFFSPFSLVFYAAPAGARVCVRRCVVSLAAVVLNVHMRLVLPTQHLIGAKLS